MRVHRVAVFLMPSLSRAAPSVSTAFLRRRPKEMVLVRELVVVQLILQEEDTAANDAWGQRLNCFIKRSSNVRVDNRGRPPNRPQAAYLRP